MHHNEVNWHRCGVLIVNFEHIHEPTAFIVGSESVFACYVRNRLKISLLILSVFEGINELISPKNRQKTWVFISFFISFSVFNFRFSDDFREN